MVCVPRDVESRSDIYFCQHIPRHLWVCAATAPSAKQRFPVPTEARSTSL